MSFQLKGRRQPASRRQRQAPRRWPGRTISSGPVYKKQQQLRRWTGVWVTGKHWQRRSPPDPTLAPFLTSDRADVSSPRGLVSCPVIDCGGAFKLIPPSQVGINMRGGLQTSRPRRRLIGYTRLVSQAACVKYRRRVSPILQVCSAVKTAPLQARLGDCISYQATYRALSYPVARCMSRHPRDYLGPSQK